MRQKQQKSATAGHIGRYFSQNGGCVTICNVVLFLEPTALSHGQEEAPKITDDRGAYNFVILNLSINANNRYWLGI